MSRNIIFIFLLLTIVIGHSIPLMMICHQSWSCTSCEYIVSGIETYINQNNTIDNIEEHVERLCGIFGSYQIVCEGEVEKYIPDIVHHFMYLEIKYKPVEICTVFGFCPNTSTIVNVF